MPTTVFVRFDSPGEVPASPSRLHAALATVLDLPRGISPGRASSFPTLAHRPHHERPGAKPYCLGELTTGPGTFGMEVRFLDDRLVETFDAWLAWGGVLRVGGARESATLIAFEGQVIAETTWQELAEQSEDTTWEIRLVTPTVFSSKGAHVRGIRDPAGVPGHQLAGALAPVGPRHRSPAHRPGRDGTGAHHPGLHDRGQRLVGDAARGQAGQAGVAGDHRLRGGAAHQRGRGGAADRGLLAPHGPVGVHERRLARRLRHGGHRRGGRGVTGAVPVSVLPTRRSGVRRVSSCWTRATTP